MNSDDLLRENFEHDRELVERLILRKNVRGLLELLSHGQTDFTIIADALLTINNDESQQALRLFRNNLDRHSGEVRQAAVNTIAEL